MAEKIIGILGGMGPEATLDCYEKIIKNTPASRDQEHLHVIIDANPKVPDRTAAILGEGESPLPLLIEGCRRLQAAGAGVIIMPCVSAHYFYPELRSQAAVPFLSIVEVVVETLLTNYPKTKTVGLLSTTGTMQGGMFQERLAAAGIGTVLCDDEEQALVMRAIYDIKSNAPGRQRREIRRDLVQVARSLIDRGAQAIIAGCTEIPLALGPQDLEVPYLDSLLILARAAIRAAGRETVPL